MKTKFSVIAIIVSAAILLAAPKQELKIITIAPVVVPAQSAPAVRRCPICGASIVEAEMLPSGIDQMSRYLRQKLNKIQGCSFLSSDDDNSGHDEMDFDKVIEAAAAQGADAVLIPVLLRYKELVGKSYAAKSPASAAFHLHLFGVRDKKEVWSFLYNETQRPLSENLLEAGKFWKRRGKFVKAESILIEGIEQAARAFPRCGEASEK